MEALNRMDAEVRLTAFRKSYECWLLNKYCVELQRMLWEQNHGMKTRAVSNMPVYHGRKVS